MAQPYKVREVVELNFRGFFGSKVCSKSFMNLIKFMIEFQC